MSAPRAIAAGLALTAALAATVCSPPVPAKQYPLTGQVLAIDTAHQRLTIKHDDIPGLMPAMIMAYDVAAPSLLTNRSPGELVTATLEVRDSLGTIVSITHTGAAPLPDTNEVALAAGILAEGDAVDDVALVDQTGRRRSLSEWKGRKTLITFIYTRCPLPDFCPLMDQNFLAVQHSLEQDAALGGRVRLISVTLDPDYDTPAVLAAHAAKRKANPALWTFLTGDRSAVERLAGQFGVAVIRDGGPPALTHNLRTAILDANEHIQKIYSGNSWTPSEVLSELRK